LIEDSIEDDWQSKSEVVDRVDPRVIHGGTGDSGEVTSVPWSVRVSE
jgi:hypothetical protein